MEIDVKTLLEINVYSLARVSFMEMPSSAEKNQIIRDYIRAIEEYKTFVLEKIGYFDKPTVDTHGLRRI